MKHIGIVACSVEGAALCYRHIGIHAGRVLGDYRHPQVTLNSIAMAEWMPAFDSCDWQGVADFMIREARAVAAAGADFAICPDNSAHLAYDIVAAASPIPWLHIADAVANAARASGFRRLALLGTRFTMRGPVYPTVLGRHGIEVLPPTEEDQRGIDRVIWDDLVHGRTPEPARLYYNEVIARLKREGCDAVILGCTEIPLLVRPDDCPLPVLDTTRLLAEAAVDHALGRGTMAADLGR